MKKIILTFIFAVTSYIVFGQARLGVSEAEIKTEFSNSRYKLTSDYNEDGIYYITIETERAMVSYLFNSDKICKASFILPNNDGALNFYVEMYNKEYVILSPTSWKVYSSQGISDIQLIYPEGGGTFFLWK